MHKRENKGANTREIGTGTEAGVGDGKAVEERSEERSEASGGGRDGDKKESAEIRIKKLPYMGIAKPLGAHLMASSKEKIWRGEYVEMLKLLHRELRAKEGTKEEEYELARRPRVPLTIENWTSAFLIYASVYCERFPERSVALLKCMDVIRKAQITYGGYAWVHYDEEFRARLSEDADGHWGELDSDLYMHTMNAEKFSKTTYTASGLPIIYRPFRGHPTQAGVGAAGRGQGSMGGGACWSFNKGICTREYCKFRHECSKCGGRHPLVQCWGLAQGGHQ